MLGELEFIFILLALAVPILAMSRVFKARTVVGPPRMLPEESTMTLTGIFLIGFTIWVFSGVTLRPVGARFLSAGHSLIAINAAAELIALCVLLWLNSKLRPRGLGQLGLAGRKLFSAPFLALATAWAIFPLVYAASIVVEMVITLTHHQMPPPHPILKQIEGSHSSLWTILMVVDAVVLAPLFEESLFRGHVQTIISHLFRRSEKPSALARWIAIIITAMLFAGIHGQVAFLFPLFVLAVGLGYLYERTGNLWASVMVHGLFNAIQITLFTAGAGK